MQRISLLLFFFAVLLIPVNSQSLPEFNIESKTVEKHLRFLASDELQGRRTGEMGNLVAARYIAEHFRQCGLTPANGESYFQKVPLVKRPAVDHGELTVGSTSFNQGKDLIILGGDAINIEAPIVFVGHGWVDPESGQDDYKGKDVKGKIVLALSGFPGADNPQTIIEAIEVKKSIAKDKGGIALIEIYSLSLPWRFFNAQFGKERLTLDVSSADEKINMPHAWIEDPEQAFVKVIREKEQEASFVSSGRKSLAIESYNVVGVLEGSDPELKNEYVLLSAHFDHVGMGFTVGRGATKEDSIFNGARDNGIGTVAMMEAAKSLAMNPPKRSIIFIGYTAEEIGLLGSAHYADHPLIPLEKTVFNLNSDGAGYNDTGVISILGFDRVGAETEMEAACEAFGLKVVADPAKEQNLFDRSDNVSLAKKGVPAPTFSPGFRQFDQEIFKYYHNASDGAESLDMDYVTKFVKAFAYAARLIADKSEKPMWIEGDKYEAVGKQLYGIN